MCLFYEWKFVFVINHQLDVRKYLCGWFQNSAAAVVWSFCSPSAVALFFGDFSLVSQLRLFHGGPVWPPGENCKVLHGCSVLPQSICDERFDPPHVYIVIEIRDSRRLLSALFAAQWRQNWLKFIIVFSLQSKLNSLHFRGINLKIKG